MRRPIIGVMPIYDYKLKNAWMLNEYFDALIEVGAIPVMLPISNDAETIKQTVDELDGFLFTGGDDVDPTLYGKECTFSEQTYLPKDEMEKKYIEEIVARDKPFFGICRGLQILNAALGGTLYQDLHKEASNHTLCIHHQDTERSSTIHEVNIDVNSQLYTILKEKRYQVNSLHHQAAQKTGKDLIATAISEDGIIEALEMPGKRFVVGVQWHPELRYKVDTTSKKLFEAFVQAAC